MAIDSEKNPISNQNERRGTTPMGERVATSLAVTNNLVQFKIWNSH
jgi:hypothetical protein